MTFAGQMPLCKLRPYRENSSLTLNSQRSMVYWERGWAGKCSVFLIISCPRKVHFRSYRLFQLNLSTVVM